MINLSKTSFIRLRIIRAGEGWLLRVYNKKDIARFHFNLRRATRFVFNRYCTNPESDYLRKFLRNVDVHVSVSNFGTLLDYLVYIKAYSTRKYVSTAVNELL